MFDLDENRPDYFDEPEADDASSEPRPNGTIDFSADYSADGSPAPKPRRRARRIVAAVVAVCAVVLAIIAWLRYFNPYATDAVVAGYVTAVERRGIFFKTFEADFISEAALTDTTRIYTRNVALSIPSEPLARRLQALQGTGRRVTLVTERYHGMLPWRGASTTVVTAIAETPQPSVSHTIRLEEADSAAVSAGE